MRILWATNGRPPALAAGALLGRLAAPDRAQVTILHATEYGNPIAAARYRDRVVEDAEAAMHEAGLPADVVVTEDGPIPSIDRQLAAQEYALTVVGAVESLTPTNLRPRPSPSS